MICSPAAEVGAAEDGRGAAEDDGWLLSLVHDQDEGRSELVVIDPRNLRQPQLPASPCALGFSRRVGRPELLRLRRPASARVASFG